MTRRAASGWRAARRLSDEEELGGCWFPVAVEMIYRLPSESVSRNASLGRLSDEKAEVGVLVGKLSDRHERSIIQLEPRFVRTFSAFRLSSGRDLGFYAAGRIGVSENASCQQSAEHEPNRLR